MLDQEQIKKTLRLASKEVKDYFGDKNVKLRAFESDYNTEVGLYPHIRYLVYKSWGNKNFYSQYRIWWSYVICGKYWRLL